MTAKIIDGRRIAAGMREKVKKAIEDKGLALKIGALLVGKNDASKVHIRQIDKACRSVGIGLDVVEVPGTAEKQEVLDSLASLEKDGSVTGILVEQPLPEHIEPFDVAIRIPPRKDIDCINPINLGKLMLGENDLTPSTPLAVHGILMEEGLLLKGKDVTIVNHSDIIGKPLAMMLLVHNASVRVAHVFTRDLRAYTKDADILITAAGVPGLIKADMVKEGALVVDVSMNRVDGKLCGDVVFDEVCERASAVTPVPGGVGPVTVASLLLNTLIAGDPEL